jgi:hypothetical protein
MVQTLTTIFRSQLFHLLNVGMIFLIRHNENSMCLWRSINWCCWSGKHFGYLKTLWTWSEQHRFHMPIDWGSLWLFVQWDLVFWGEKEPTPKCIGRMIQERLNKFPQIISTHRSRRNVNYLWILDAVQKSDRYREEQSDHVYYSSLGQVYKFALPRTSLSNLCTNAGPKTLLPSKTGMFSLLFIQF